MNLLVEVSKTTCRPFWYHTVTFSQEKSPTNISQYNGDVTRFIVKQSALGEKVRGGVANKYGLDPGQIRLMYDADYIVMKETLKGNGLEAGRTYHINVVVEQLGGGPAI